MYLMLFFPSILSLCDSGLCFLFNRFAVLDVKLPDSAKTTCQAVSADPPHVSEAYLCDQLSWFMLVSTFNRDNITSTS